MLKKYSYSKFYSGLAAETPENTFTLSLFPNWLKLVGKKFQSTVIFRVNRFTSFAHKRAKVTKLTGGLSEKRLKAPFHDFCINTQTGDIMETTR